MSRENGHLWGKVRGKFKLMFSAKTTALNDDDDDVYDYDDDDDDDDDVDDDTPSVSFTLANLVDGLVSCTIVSE